MAAETQIIIFCFNVLFKLLTKTQSGWDKFDMFNIYYILRLPEKQQIPINSFLLDQLRRVHQLLQHRF